MKNTQLLLTLQGSLRRHHTLPLGAVDPGHWHILQDDHDSERQTSGVVVKHGDKVVPRALDEEEATEKGYDAAAHWKKNIERELEQDEVKAFVWKFAASSAFLSLLQWWSWINVTLCINFVAPWMRKSLFIQSIACIAITLYSAAKVEKTTHP